MAKKKLSTPIQQTVIILLLVQLPVQQLVLKLHQTIIANERVFIRLICVISRRHFLEPSLYMVVWSLEDYQMVHLLQLPSTKNTDHN